MSRGIKDNFLFWMNSFYGPLSRSRPLVHRDAMALTECSENVLNAATTKKVHQWAATFNENASKNNAIVMTNQTHWVASAFFFK